MAGERAQNLQDTFLNHVRKNKIPLTIFLVNGVKLQGVVTWFDNFCVLLAPGRTLAAGLQARDLDDHARTPGSIVRAGRGGRREGVALRRFFRGGTLDRGPSPPTSP